MLHFSASAICLIKRGNFAEARHVNDYLQAPTNHSPHVKESKTVLDSGFHPSEFQILTSGYFVSGNWIPDFNRQLNSRFIHTRIHTGTHKNIETVKTKWLLLPFFCTRR